MAARPHRPEARVLKGDALFDAGRRRALRAKLLRWYGRHARDLPWRRTRDPYRIWLSEAMLQQTRVETVIPFYERFVDRFPDLNALADADEQDVLHAWSGLGYYSRARNLKRAAEAMVRDHAGRVPDDPDALLRLPGIGRYTAGAVASIAFGKPVPIVDGNVRRVLSRVCGLKDPRDTELWQAAGELVRGTRPDQFNQALMELGATVCSPKAPACLASTCPIAGHCAAAATGRPEDFPAPRKRPAPRRVEACAAALRSRSSGKLLLVRRPRRGLLGGLWELPTLLDATSDELCAWIRREFGVQAAPGPRLGELRHSFTHRDLRLAVFAAGHGGGRLRTRDSDSAARWCSAAEIEALPLSRLTRKALALAVRPRTPDRARVSGRAEIKALERA